MPATEQTRYPIKRLHRIFAVSSVILLAVTVWMFVDDHRRPWKRFQRTANKIEARTSVWKKCQFETDEAVRQRRRLQQALEAAARQAIASEPLDQFRAAVAAEAARLDIVADLTEFDRRRAKLEAAAQAIPADGPAGPADAEALRAARAAMLDAMRDFIAQAMFRETRQVNRQKSIRGDLDVARANVGVALRSGRPEEEIARLQRAVDQLQLLLRDVSTEVDARQDHRLSLEEILAQVTEEEQQLEKKLAASRADLKRLEDAIVERRSTWVHYDYGFPLPGKRVLELPLLDAFNSPLRIHNLWAEGLTQDYHFTEVLRFDRCTTCHTAVQDNASFSTALPEFPQVQELRFSLPLPDLEKDEPADADAARAADGRRFEAAFGTRLTAEGLLDPADVTVMYVRPQSPAAAHHPVDEPTPPQSDVQIYHDLLWPPDTMIAEVQPGLRMGDVLVAIDDRPVPGRWAAIRGLLEAARDKGGDAGNSVVLTIRRGLPNPYNSHPRLDLYVGELSPHKMSEFACTVCHGGQGSATDFKWASHSPNSESARKRWRREYDWFDNPHWDDPMFPNRFAESSCLKCHHRVVDLEPSQRFPDPPAPKLMRGYRLVKAYGCYGCHEIDGYQGDRSVGPDLRLEPSYVAAGDVGSAAPSDESGQGLPQDGRPGTFRRPGPSLRYVGHKLDTPFMVDWLRDPRRFRPSTEMPRSFGLWDHLEGRRRQMAKDFEPVEIAGVVAYLQAQTQELSALEPSAGAGQRRPEERIERGRQRFQIAGCLACHNHKEFPDAAQFRDDNKIVSGPDLSRIADKLQGDRGRKWLDTFIKEPTRYYPRTIMPNLYLEPETRAGATDEETDVTDPADEIVEFLLARSSSEYVPAPLSAVSERMVDRLLRVHLSDVFRGDRFDAYLQKGIPARVEPTLAAAERELLVTDAEHDSAAFRLSTEQKLRYVGFKSIAKNGCFGCHDIVGFESAKPIGTALADWGRIDPSRLAFENVVQYVEKSPAGSSLHASAGGLAATETNAADGDVWEAYYRRQLRSHSRIGFAYQKLAEPRSYDYAVATNKPYKDRLRMPQFAFSPEQREAILTFVLGLVAQPPADKYVYTPDRRRAAVIRGESILEKYACGQCHMLQPERWRLAFSPGSFGPQRTKPSYPFVAHAFSEDRLQQSLELDRRGLLQATVSGMPNLGVGGRPLVFDDYGDQLFDDESYDPATLEYAFQLWKPAALEGHPYQVGESAVSIWGDQLEGKRPSDGGFLARYLLPHVVELEKKANPNAVGSQAWGWLPPPLENEGRKVRPEWLYSYLLEPYPIRPAAFMRMPRFTLSSDEARALVDYFAARDGVEYPYAFVERRSPGYLQKMEQQYRQRLAADGGEPAEVGRTRLGDAMRIVSNKNFCVTCHIVGSFDPVTSLRAKGPDLAEVYRRLRPDYLRRWIAKPTSELPYTAMQVVLPYDPDDAHLGGVDQSLYRGTSVQQLDAVVDVLTNLDVYARTHGALVPQTDSEDERSSEDPDSVTAQ